MGLKFNFKSLQAFATFAETEHVTKAAEILNVSQSPLSRRLRDFEAELGIALFARSGRGLALTKAGRQLVPEAQRLISAAQAFQRRAEAIANGAHGQLRIGCVPGALQCRTISDALGALIGADMSCSIAQMRSSAQFDALVHERIDLGLAHRRAQSDQLVSREIFSEPFCLAKPAGRKWDQGRIPFAAPSGPDDAWLFDACADVGLSIDIQHRADDPFGALNLVAAGLCATIVQESVAHRKHAGVIFSPLSDDFSLRFRVLAVHRLDAPKEITELLDAM
ncbi:MAG: DNA-binding transcriptional LysR family regulator [Halocynthiibacter sp.]|jgi:DNA-binding transcriptional LysR family regulator